MTDLQSAHDEHAREKLRLHGELQARDLHHENEKAFLLREIKSQHEVEKESMRVELAVKRRFLEQELVMAKTAATEHDVARKDLDGEIGKVIT